jgi:muconolactone delta-isomerase
MSPILNYTTTVDIGKTIIDIEKVLVAHGAQSITKDYQDGNPIALCFLIKSKHVLLPVRLPVDTEAVLRVMKEQRARPGLLNREQATRVAWRIIKDWVEAQMAILETEQAKLEQVFLPYIQTPNGTIFQLFQEKQGLFLTQG